MSGIVHIVGDAEGALAARLGAISLPVEQETPAVLVTLSQTAEAAIQAAREFAAPAGEEDRLVVHIWREPDPADWPQVQQAATLAAFTRHAALAWAGRRVRVNAVVLLNTHRAPVESALAADVAKTIVGLAGWPSMTGQIIRLSA